MGRGICFTNADCDGDNAWGVEAAEWSESESKEEARLCIERDWVSLEFIRARRVTWTQRFRGEIEAEIYIYHHQARI